MALRAGLHGTVGQPSAQVIDGSLKFVSGNSTHLTRTPGSAGNRKTWTFSCWVKVGSLSQGERGTIFSSNASGALGGPTIYQNNGLRFAHAYDPTGTDYIRETVALFRDPSAWYHVVWWCDMTQSTTRWKIYVNGVQQALQTPAIANGEPNQNTNLGINSADEHTIGEFASYSYLDGYLSQAYFVDGQALGPEYFGFTDPLTNTWRPKKYKPQATPNNGTTWSSTGSDPNSKISGGSIANVFSGSLTTGITINQSSSNEYVTMTTGPIQCNSTVSFFSGNGASTATMRINGSDTYKFTAGSTTQQWWDFSFSGTITKIELGYLDGSGSANAFYGIMVDGVPLVDGDTNNIGVNGFYLPMDGNSPIGEDKSGNGNDFTPVNFSGSAAIDKATGALPILNTFGDNGKIALPSVRTDAYASNLVVALPLLDNANDVCNQINSSQTNVTVTNTGSITFPSVETNFYSGGPAFIQNANTQQLTFTNYGNRFLFTGDYTIECWVYPTDSGTGDGSLFVISNNIGYFAFNFDPGTGFNIYNNTGIPSWSPSTNLPPANKWSHVALVRSGSTQTVYVNGQSIATNTSSGTHGYASADITLGPRIGGGANPSLDLYLQDFRIYNGVAKYTQNFIPASTDPDILPDTPSGVAGGSALTKITDGSVSFDGSGDSLVLTDNGGLDPGSGDFTLECFINTNNISGERHYPIIQKGNTASNNNFDWRLYFNDSINSTSHLWFDAECSGTTVNMGSGSFTNMSTNRWYHCAVTRESGTFRVFLDGVLQGSNSSTTNAIDNVYTGVEIGFNDLGGAGDTYLDGYVSNVRFVKGTALYTSNFAPPTKALTNITNTTLLCCQSPSSATAAAVSPGSITANGNASATNFNPLTTDINAVRGQESGYCTLNPIGTTYGFIAPTDGNLKTDSNAYSNSTEGTFAIPKDGNLYYFEGTMTRDVGDGGTGLFFGCHTQGHTTDPNSTSGKYFGPYGTDGGAYDGAIFFWQYSNYLGTAKYGHINAGTVLAHAIKYDSGTWKYWWRQGSNGWHYWNGSSWVYNMSFDETKPTGSSGNVPESEDLVPLGNNIIFNFGQKPFVFTPPEGSKVLCLANIREQTEINKVKLDRTHTGSAVSIISGLSFTQTGTWHGTVANKWMNRGKWYYEFKRGSGGTSALVGLATPQYSGDTEMGVTTDGYRYRDDGTKRYGGSAGVAYGDTWTSGTPTIGVAFDLDAGKLWFSLNGVWQASGDPAAGTGEAFSGLSGIFAPAAGFYNGTNASTFNFGETAFTYSIPTGFSAYADAFEAVKSKYITRPDKQVRVIEREGQLLDEANYYDMKTATSNSITQAYFNDAVYGYNNTFSGLANSDYYEAAGWCQWRSRNGINGYYDWYQPAKWEVEVLYYNLKPGTTDNATGVYATGANSYAVPSHGNYTYNNPAQTSVAIFQAGGSEAIMDPSDNTPSSTPPAMQSSYSGSTVNKWIQSFNNGYMSHSNAIGGAITRLIRREPYTGNEPAIGSEYAGGYLAGFISTSANSVATHALIISPRAQGQFPDTTQPNIYNSATGIFSKGMWMIKPISKAGDWRIVDSVRGLNNVVTNPTLANETTYTSVKGPNIAYGWSLPDKSDKTYSVRVVSDSGNKYRFDGFGTSAVTLELEEGSTYTFDQSDSTNSGHPLRFSTTSDGTHGAGSEYTTGVVTSGTPGSAGAYTRITIPSGAPTLYYYCSVHSGMGGQANTNTTSGASNFDGLLASVVSVSKETGFSAVKYTGNGVNTQSWGHGLENIPEFVIIKKRTNAASVSWAAYHQYVDPTSPENYWLNFSGSNARISSTGTSGIWKETKPTSKTFTVAWLNETNASGEDYIAYCWHSVPNFSKFGTYEGNDTDNNAFVHLGFKPAVIIIKSVDTADPWHIIDSERRSSNPFNTVLRPSTTDYDIWTTGFDVDILSNGFKIRSGNSSLGDPSTYVYAAWAEVPTKNLFGGQANAR